MPTSYFDGEEGEVIKGKRWIAAREYKFPVYVLLQHPVSEHDEPLFILRIRKVLQLWWQKRVWNIEMNDSRDFYLGVYEKFDYIDHPNT